MNPSDTVQASEEMEAGGEEEAIPARSLPFSSAANAQRNSRTRIDASTSSIVVWTLSEGERNEPSACSKQNGGGAFGADCVNRLFLHGSIWARGSTRCAPDVGSDISRVTDDVRTRSGTERTRGFYGTTTCRRSRLAGIAETSFQIRSRTVDTRSQAGRSRVDAHGWVCDGGESC